MHILFIHKLQVPKILADLLYFLCIITIKGY
jgi:hypothetical protein